MKYIFHEKEFADRFDCINFVEINIHIQTMKPWFCYGITLLLQTGTTRFVFETIGGYTLVIGL